MERTVGCAHTHVPDNPATPTPALGVTARLLDRLTHVRRSHGGWRADCPHGHRSAGTLAISEAVDGSVLLHCFAGCTPEQVLKAVGLTLADLYPEPLKVVSLSDRRMAQQVHREAAWPAALGVLAREATIALIAARDLAQGRTLTLADLARLEDAVRRINHCREVLQ